jgi:hypothetical protein
VNARETRAIARLEGFKTLLDVASDYNRLMMSVGEVHRIFLYKEGIGYVFAHRTIEGRDNAVAYMRHECIALFDAPVPRCTCPRMYATTQEPLGADMHTASCETSRAVQKNCACPHMHVAVPQEGLHDRYERLHTVSCETSGAERKWYEAHKEV